ncbi:hypothetical protein E2C01_022936 [Portunus trituberculatus]|uniref:Uncharacterized protein n=1 Tax=Portunus trituberculatus TaxID=210409 RepID=A0A5B7E6P9_PORTR|nr:hypothetical protein [Portunus trituberculatus]
MVPVLYVILVMFNQYSGVWGRRHSHSALKDKARPDRRPPFPRPPRSWFVVVTASPPSLPMTLSSNPPLLTEKAHSNYAYFRTAQTDRSRRVTPAWPFLPPRAGAWRGGPGRRINLDFLFIFDLSATSRARKTVKCKSPSHTGRHFLLAARRCYRKKKSSPGEGVGEGGHQSLCWGLSRCDVHWLKTDVSMREKIQTLTESASCVLLSMCYRWLQLELPGSLVLIPSAQIHHRPAIETGFGALIRHHLYIYPQSSGQGAQAVSDTGLASHPSLGKDVRLAIATRAP